MKPALATDFLIRHKIKLFFFFFSAVAAMRDYKVPRRKPDIPHIRASDSVSISKSHQYVDQKRERHTKGTFFSCFFFLSQNK
jgi:hypothetical protein